MRKLTCAGLGAGMALAAAAALAEAPAKPKRPPAPPAVSAERYGVTASYRATPFGHGYSARDRHVADCLATYRRYDPAKDRIVVRPGVTRRCPL